MIGVSEDDLGGDIALQFRLMDGFHGSSRADGHENGGLDFAVRGRDSAGSGAGFGVCFFENEVHDGGEFEAKLGSQKPKTDLYFCKKIEKMKHRSFQAWMTDDLQIEFGLQKKEEMPLLNEWLNAPPSMTEEEKKRLTELRDYLRKRILEWKEQEIIMHFIGPLLTLVQVNTALRAYIDPTRWVWVFAGDFKP